MAGDGAQSGDELRHHLLHPGRSQAWLGSPGQRTPEKTPGIQWLPPGSLSSSSYQPACQEMSRAESCLGWSHRENRIKQTLLGWGAGGHLTVWAGTQRGPRGREHPSLRKGT